MYANNVFLLHRFFMRIYMYMYILHRYFMRIYMYMSILQVQRFHILIRFSS